MIFYVLFIFYYFSHQIIFTSPLCNHKPTHTSQTPLSRSSTNPPSWLEEEEASIASSSYSKKQQQPFPQQQQPAQQKPMQLAPQQQILTQTQPQHSPGSNELKLSAAQQSMDDKSLFDNDGGENETKSVSSMRSQDR